MKICTWQWERSDMMYEVEEPADRAGLICPIQIQNHFRGLRHSYMVGLGLLGTQSIKSHSHYLSMHSERSYCTSIKIRIWKPEDVVEMFKFFLPVLLRSTLCSLLMALKKYILLFHISHLKCWICFRILLIHSYRISNDQQLKKQQVSRIIKRRNIWIL